MNIQIDVSSCDESRNKIIEPGAPTYRERLKNIEKLSNIPGLASLVVRMDPLLPNVDDTENIATQALTEITPTISKQELYSLPFEIKLQRLNMIRKWCYNYGINLSVCGSKDERFKQTDIEWICHPFNRKRREELNKNVAKEMQMATDHLK